MKNGILSVVFCMLSLGSSAALAGPGDATPTAAHPPGASEGIAPAEPSPAPTATPATPSVVAPAETVAGDVRAAYDAIVRGEWVVAAGFALSLLVLGVRRYGVKAIDLVGGDKLSDWLLTDRGGVVLVFALSLLGSVAHAAIAKAPVNLSTLHAAAVAAITAIGGYAGLRRFVWPQDVEAEPVEGE